VSPDPVSRRGGARPGAGRPVRDTVEITVHVSSVSHVKLQRLAVKRFGRHVPGGPWIGAVIDSLVEPVVVTESAAVRLAREAGLLPKM